MRLYSSNAMMFIIANVTVLLWLRFAYTIVFQQKLRITP